MGTEKRIAIDLESWQTRQLEDYLPSQKIEGLDPTKITGILVNPGKGGCLASYKVINVISKGFEIYLTDPQIIRVQRELGRAAEVVSVTISGEAIQNEAVGFMR